ncbi:transcriptional regulator, partial [Listeria monocytogenes]|nr:transcriptional regulator [Listeria monocytogenes]
MLLQSKSNEMLIEKVMDEFSAATSLASVVVDIH